MESCLYRTEKYGNGSDPAIFFCQIQEFVANRVRIPVEIPGLVIYLTWYRR
jgi:hypothetical protein